MVFMPKKNQICYNINMKTVKRNLSQNLKLARQKAGYTQKYVAMRLQISIQAYQAYENEKTCPTIPHLVALSNLYHLSLDQLIGRKKDVH